MSSDEAAETHTQAESSVRVRRLIWLAPLGLAINIMLSLWVSYRHVDHSVVVQVEPEWQAGERLALRAQLLDGARKGVEKVKVGLQFVDASGARFKLGELPAIEGGRLNQGAIVVPSEAALGVGQLEVEFEGVLPRGRAVRPKESISVAVVEARTPHGAAHTIASSMLQWGDDTDPQPEELRIDLQPFGRLLAGFENEFLVRITDHKGQPLSRKVEVRLVSGELGGETGPGAAKIGSGVPGPLLFAGVSDGIGLVRFSATMDTDVIRLDVSTESLAPPSVDAPPDPLTKVESAKRRFRLVSFAGGVRLEASTLAASAGDTIKLQGYSLQSKRPIYVDVHGPDGAWLDTFMPPLRSFAPPRDWTLPQGIKPGFVHFEGYPYTNAPGESAEVIRMAISDDDSNSPGSIGRLIEAQLARLDLPRDKTGFDPAHERAYLDKLPTRLASANATTIDGARRWLMGSLPVEVYGPPLATSTRGREEATLEASKRAWTLGLRAVLWGGGALLILGVGVALWRQQRRLVAQTREVLGDAAESMSISARGDLLTRAIVVLVLLVSALVLAAMMLESLVWEF